METKSSIIAIGLSVHHTPVEIREKLSIPQVWMGNAFCPSIIGSVLGWACEVGSLALCDRLVLNV